MKEDKLAEREKEVQERESQMLADLAERETEVQERESKMVVELEEKEKEIREMVQKELEEAKTTLVAEKQEWEEEKKKVKKTKTFEKIVTLNVGGTKYTTSLSTLTKYQDSMLGAMFSGRHALPQQEDGSYFMDVDGEYFRYILSYLRDRNRGIRNLSKLTVNDCDDVKYLSHYFQLQELETFALISIRNRKHKKLNVVPIRENPIVHDHHDIGIKWPTKYSVTSHKYVLDYEVEIEDKILTCTSTCSGSAYQGLRIEADTYQNAEFNEKIEQCNLTDV